MVKEFVDAWNGNRDEAAAALRIKLPTSYDDLVNLVVGYIGMRDALVTKIEGSSDYSGKDVYVIGRGDDFWAVGVWYGSCSGCDTIQGILEEGYGYDEPTESQVSQMMTMALHIVQKLQPIE